MISTAISIPLFRDEITNRLRDPFRVRDDGRFQGRTVWHVGVCAPFSRRMGASRSSKPRSATWAAISRPYTEGNANASSTIRSRPVFDTDCKIVSTSNGSPRCARSISSTDIPSLSNISQAFNVIMVNHQRREPRLHRCPRARTAALREFDLIILCRHVAA